MQLEKIYCELPSEYQTLSEKKNPLSGDMYQFLDSFLAVIAEGGGAPLFSSGYRLYLL